MTESLILAFSGGLDTSISVPWLREKFGYDVITLTVDVGQGEDLKMIERRAYLAGSSKHVTIDAREEFAKEYVFPALRANALYEGKYPLATALARPLIAQKLVGLAKSEGSSIISHGCTGKGNDQARFDITIKALFPSARIIAPVREWNLSREAELEYASKIALELGTKSEYSIDQNLWGRSIEGGTLEDPAVEPPAEIFEWVRSISSSPDSPEDLDIGFEDGVPTAINGNPADPVDIISILNSKAGMHGIGVIDHVENRIMGLKSREIYEAPAALTLIEAHKDLEKLVLTRQELEMKAMIEAKWAWMVYSGLWIDPLVEALNAFIDTTQKRVTGHVKIRLHKGSCRVIGRESTKSIYNLSLATYGKNSTFNQRSAEAFIEIWGMQSRLAKAVAK